MTFNEIWNKHKSHLLNFTKTKMDDENIAEDVLQEVSLKLIDNLNRKTEIKNYKTWIDLAKRQRYFVNSTFTKTAVSEVYKNVLSIADESINKIPKAVELKLPALKKIELPKLQKVGE